MFSRSLGKDMNLLFTPLISLVHTINCGRKRQEKFMDFLPPFVDAFLFFATRLGSAGAERFGGGLRTMISSEAWLVALTLPTIFIEIMKVLSWASFELEIYVRAHSWANKVMCDLKKKKI
jgi:hypothetical protein